jgi:hypothetical protein
LLVVTEPAKEDAGPSVRVAVLLPDKLIVCAVTPVCVSLARDKFPQPAPPKPTTDIVCAAANVEVPPFAPNVIAPVEL